MNDPIVVGNDFQDLCDKLIIANNLLSSKIFDTIECVNSNSVECKIGESLAVKFLTDGGHFTARVYSSGGSSAAPALQSGYFSLIVVTSKSIILFGYYNKEVFIISRDTYGNAIAICHCDSDGFIRNPHNQSSIGLRTYSILGDSNGRRYYYANDDTTNRKSYFIPILIDDDRFSDDVYVSVVRPYPDEQGWVSLTINSVGYIGVGGTTFIIEST